MTEIVLYKSPWKAIKIFPLTAPFLAVGLWMIISQDSNSIDIFMGWIGLCFSVLVILVGLFHLFDRRPQIIINEIGIWDRTTNQDLIKWELIEDAYPINISGQNFISLKLADSFDSKVKQYKWATRLSRSVGAQKVNLHLGQLKINPNCLSDLILKMNRLELSERKTEIKNVAQQLNLN